MLNWILITMLVMLPLRTVLAIDQSCQMHDQASQQPAEHHMHTGHIMPETDQDDTVASDNCCCCDSSMSCNFDCGIGMSASVIMQHALTVPVLNKSSFRTQVVNNLVFRELIPLTRPPAYL
jgi:hypothetical protein